MLKKNKNIKSSEGLVTLDNPHSYISEEFKTIRTNIQFAMVNKKLKTVLVTSSNPNEGKTTICANLAVTFANQGKKVLLVDADMRNPSIHQKFHCRNNKGLTNLLSDCELSVNSVISATSQRNLFLLTCGPIPPNPSELLDSLRMDEIIGELSEEYELILFDLPPIIAVTDAQVMVPKVDGTVFVIRNGFVDKRDLAKAKELLEYTHGNIIGAIFNDKKSKQDIDGYYSYGTVHY